MIPQLGIARKMSVARDYYFVRQSDVASYDGIAFDYDFATGLGIIRYPCAVFDCNFATNERFSSSECIAFDFCSLADHCEIADPSAILARVGEVIFATDEASFLALLYAMLWYVNQGLNSVHDDALAVNRKRYPFIF
jgi:hypothetical protein